MVVGGAGREALAEESPTGPSGMEKEKAGGVGIPYSYGVSQGQPRVFRG